MVDLGVAVCGFADADSDAGEGVVVDFDKQGHIVGLEVLDAADKLGLESILTVTIDTLLAEQPS